MNSKVLQLCHDHWIGQHLRHVVCAANGQVGCDQTDIANSSGVQPKGKLVQCVRILVCGWDMQALRVCNQVWLISGRTLLANVFNLMQVNIFYQQLMLGVIVLIAVATYKTKSLGSL